MMKYSSAMIGNSSSGIIESSSFELPVLNIGDRQKGRVQSYNVINVSYNEKKITEGIKKITEDDFRKKLVGMKNPYGDGESSLRISKVLENVSINKDLIIKKFNNL